MKIKYWRIGTDPLKYINNWLSFCSLLNVGEKLTIEANSIKKNLDSNYIFECNSESTFSQNVIVWEMCGLCKQTGQNTIVVLNTENQTLIEIVDNLKWLLLTKSKKERCQTLKNSIMLKTLLLCNKVPNNIEIVPIKNNFGENYNIDLIKRDVSKLDKMLFQDKAYVEAVCKKWSIGE